ncbi:hypothetical protein ACIBG8_22545 [Nonomuraea sp. NPDC050556]|uniref:hypothetical protein n=1 Tax=Nonomuraea sp. NPDC050556 TaxID=3364369 RepID=UPI00378AD1E2
MRRTLALAVLAAALTGCGMLPGQPQSGGSGEEKQAVTTAATTVPPPKEQATAQPEQGKAIAQRKLKSGKTELEVKITGLKREGKLATLTWTVTNVGSENWEMTSSMGMDDMGLTVAGVNLVDTANGKIYRVARTGTYPRSKCLCSDYEVYTDPGEMLSHHATFAAPPQDVTKVNVDLRVLGVFTDVPIS